MSAMPNSHEALLRNLPLLTGRTALLGVSSPALLAALPTGGLAMTEHAGHCQALSGQPGWQVCFGYDSVDLEAGSFDTVVVFMPKARAEMDLRLALARWLARKDGILLMVGEKREGIAGAARQLQAVAADAMKVDSARHCQLWRASNAMPLASFDLDQWRAWYPVSSAGVSFEVAGLPGIFSQGELDAGTAMLLDSLANTPLRADRVLDFACGAGVIGTWLQCWQKAQGRTVTPVDGVDVQFQAVTCARATYERAGAEGSILASDGLAGVDGIWPAIVTNPPFHSGVRTDTSMTENFLRAVSRHLGSRGELRLVANSFLPYENLIQRFIGPVEKLVQDRRFTVYRATRR